MSLDIKEIEHLAKLARLDIKTAEKKKFAHQLGDILDYFNQLQELDTRGVDITSQVINLVNISRVDESKVCSSHIQKDIFTNAPQTSGRYFKVNKVF